MTDRGNKPVVDFPVDAKDQSVQEALDVLRAALGRLVAIEDLCLISVNGGLGIVGAVDPGTTLSGSIDQIDLSDAYCDQVRLIARAKNSNGNIRTIRLYDLTNSTTLVDLQITAGTTETTYVSAWTALTVKGGDRNLEVRVVGNGAETQTLYSVHAQFRTTRFAP